MVLNNYPNICRSFFANRSMLGYEDEDSNSLDRMEVEEVVMPNSPPPLSPQAVPPPQHAAVTPPTPPSPVKLSGKSQSPSTADIEFQKLTKKQEKDKSSKPFKSKKYLEKDPPCQINGNSVDHTSESDKETEVSKEQVGKKKKLAEEPLDKSLSKKRRRSDKKIKSKEVLDTTESDSDKEKEEDNSGDKDSESSEKSPKIPTPLDNIPTDMRFEPKNLVVKPKGLVDALSNFFTPGLSRATRTAMNSLIKPESTSIIKNDSNKVSETPKEVEAKKVRLSVDEKLEEAKKEDSKSLEERRRHASAGQQQVKSLYDGLSHLYSDCDSRLRSAPNPSEKASEKAGDKSSDPAKPSEERVTSPMRMSDSEIKEKEEGKKEEQKVEDGDKTKGSSKKNIEMHGGLSLAWPLFF